MFSDIVIHEDYIHIQLLFSFECVSWTYHRAVKLFYSTPATLNQPKCWRVLDLCQPAFSLVIFAEKFQRCQNKVFILSRKNPPICSHQPCKRCQKNHPVTNPLLFSMLNNGWRKPMNPWANGFYSRLSARILLRHCPFSSSPATHILSALCVCVRAHARANIYMHTDGQLNARWLNPSSQSPPSSAV